MGDHPASPSQLQGCNQWPSRAASEQRKPPEKTKVLMGPPRPAFLQIGHPFGSRLDRFMAPQAEGDSYKNCEKRGVGERSSKEEWWAMGFLPGRASRQPLWGLRPDQGPRQHFPTEKSGGRELRGRGRGPSVVTGAWRPPQGRRPEG